ncbi:NHL repeat-containing protein [Turneriella parva]|uniref:NHL repeat containing protein n=1 Tax=Turneriella parva (strain ATCC BAA-1111 / DSM 21527 / NCTC 11395 / H) TaxID=869212 RepID=I4B880_TURPD|nr:NHL repeat-containing protein [Turneriella parva]AFM13487.1 NHL repeat containing protein [Turneriella parva DSM 21527]
MPSASFIALIALVAAGCGQYLHQFADEDSEIQLEILSDTAANPTFSVATRQVSFDISFRADRNGSYRVLHGAGCSGTQAAGGTNVSGNLSKGSTVASAISLPYDDLATYGRQITICMQDTAAYKTTAAIRSFSSGLDTVLLNLATLYNENGGGGANINSGTSAAFMLFQTNWTNVLENRNNGNGGPYAGNGVDSPYSHGVYIDPNHGYRLKYFVADRDNHRILIFNSLPTSNAATADVVVGQTGFTTGFTTAANAGGAISAQGFDQPQHVSVSANGTMFVTDLMNHRVLIYNSVPQTNGVAANTVIGQPGFTTGVLNNGTLVAAARLNSPAAASMIQGRLYIADQANNRIVVFNSIPTGPGASASFAIGQGDTATTTSGTDYSTQSSYMNSPYDMFADQSSPQRLYVADGGNHRVLVYTALPTGADVRANFVIGHSGPNFALANRGAAQPANNSLNQPRSIVAQNNKLAIADQGNNRILFYDLPVNADDPAATHVLGQTDFISGGAGTTQTTFNIVKGLIFDNGYIWAADQANHRVKVIALPY